LQSYLSCPGTVFPTDPFLSPIIFRLCTGHCKLNHHLSRIGLHRDGLCGQCEIPETVEHMIEVCPKYLTARKRLKTCTQSIWYFFSYPRNPPQHSCCKACRNVCARVGRTSTNSFYTVLALQDLVVRKCHQPPS